MTPAILLAAVLTWTAPNALRLSCGPGAPARDAMRCVVLRPRGQYPAYYRGIEANASDWAALIAWCRPDTVATVWAVPAQRCSVTVAPGAYRVVACNGAGCGCESPVVVVP